MKLQNMPELKISGRKVPLQTRSRERVELIIDSAEKLLLKVNLAGITTSRIAEEAGIPVGSIYQYFKDRDAVLLALGERVIRGQDRKLEKVFEEVSAHAHWRHVVKVVIRAFVDNIFEGDMHMRLDAALSNNSEWQDIHQLSEDRIVSIFAGYPLYTKKAVPHKKAMVISRTIVLLVRATVYRSKLMTSQEEEEMLIEETERMIIAYLSTIFGD